METGINKVIEDGNGSALIFTALIAATIANILPVPTDALYFKAQQNNKMKLENGIITPKQFWIRDITGYYTYTALWYGGLVLLISATNSSFKNQARLLLALLSGGLVVGVAVQNIRKDEAIADAAKIHGTGVNAANISAVIPAPAPVIPKCTTPQPTITTNINSIFTCG